MGNRLCKKKSGDVVDYPKAKDNTFDRIMTRLHLKPNSWKSESQLSKEANRLSKSNFEGQNRLENTKPLSRSTDWMEATLEVPEKDSPIHLRNPKLSLIFNHEDEGTPTPPPRKHKKGIREKIEAVAKSGLQALQSRKPVEEPLCIKKTMNYDCPCDRLNHKHNHRDHNNTQEKNIINKEQQKLEHAKKLEQIKESKRKKNLSVVSLPNYSELKFSVANFGDIDRQPSDETSIKLSNVSLPGEAKKSGSKSYMIRCRSFGSLLPQQLLEKLKPPSNKKVDVESDDSFGPLEDWDLGLIEHYNPRDASLPRPRKPLHKSENNILSDIENLILKEEVPTPPARRSELSMDDQKTSKEISTGKEDSKTSNFVGGIKNQEVYSIPPPRTSKFEKNFNWNSHREDEEDGKVEHSSLMRILEEFSIKDKNSAKNKEVEGDTKTDKRLGQNTEVEKGTSEPIIAEKCSKVNDTNVKSDCLQVEGVPA